MRVLFVNENIGGHQTVHVHLERALRLHHPEIEAEFFHVPPARLGRRLVGAAVPWLGHLDLDFQPLRAQLAQSVLVEQWLRGQVARFDAIHLYTHNAGLCSVPILRHLASVVSLDTTNQLNAYRIPGRPPTRWTGWTLPPTKVLERRVYEAADFIVSHSDWAAQSLRRDYWVPAGRIRVIPFGITIPAKTGSPLEHTGSLPMVTFVGRQMERKGGWLLLDLWRRRLRGHCTLAFVTQDPVPEEADVRWIRGVVPGDGRIEQVLRNTSVLALPSEIDFSPNVVLEAMAMAVPVVAFRTGGLPEMVADGVTGRLVPQGDYEAFGDALLALLDDTALRAAMGSAGRARAVARFDARVTTAQLVEVLTEAVRSHASGAPK